MSTATPRSCPLARRGSREGTAGTSTRTSGAETVGFASTPASGPWGSVGDVDPPARRVDADQPAARNDVLRVGVAEFDPENEWDAGVVLLDGGQRGLRARFAAVLWGRPK